MIQRKEGFVLLSALYMDKLARVESVFSNFGKYKCPHGSWLSELLDYGQASSDPGRHLL